MLHEFLARNRADLIARCRAKVAARTLPDALAQELDHGITVFLEQLIQTLAFEQSAGGGHGGEPPRPAGVGPQVLSAMGKSAAAHGRELLENGFTVGELVHDYGDLCQSVTELALERQVPFTMAEFRTLNRCLDDAIATAISEYAYHRDVAIADRQADAFNVRLGQFAHELRNHLSTATLALMVIRTGNVGLNSATGAVLDRSLVQLRNLIDHSLSDVRIRAGIAIQPRLFSLANFIGELKSSAELEASVQGCTLHVDDVDPGLALEADRDLLLSAVGNLLQNAFKFTRPGSEVSLRAHAAGDRIRIEVGDQCGGLAPGSAELLFAPFSQGHEDRSGLGLGLSIARQGVEANHGRLGVEDRPGVGCVFTIELPRHALSG